MKDANLAIRRGPKSELLSHTSHIFLIMGFFKDIEIIIEEFQTRHSIFGVKASGHDFVLSQLFSKLVKFCNEYKANEIFETSIHFYTYLLAVFKLWQRKLRLINEIVKFFLTVSMKRTA